MYTCFICIYVNISDLTDNKILYNVNMNSIEYYEYCIRTNLGLSLNAN